MDQVSSIYNPGNDFFWREEGPCRARARTSPARPSLGVPPTRCGGFPVTALRQTRLNLQVNSSLGQPAWFAAVPWTGTSRSQVGVPPKISSFVSRQIQSKKQIRLGFFECSCHIGFLRAYSLQACSLKQPTAWNLFSNSITRNGPFAIGGALREEPNLCIKWGCRPRKTKTLSQNTRRLPPSVPE